MRAIQTILGLALMLSAALLPVATRAQDLKDPTGPVEDGLAVDLMASAEIRSGNVNFLNLSDQLWARYRQDVHYVSLRTSHSLGEQGGARFMNALRGLAQYRYNLVPQFLGGFGLEAIGMYDRDEFRRREHLLNAGGGAYVQVFDTQALRWNATVGYVFEFEKFARLTSADDPGEEARDSRFELNSHRAWFGSEFGWEIAERVHVGEDLAIQVPLDHCPCDTRVLSTTYLRVYGNDYVGLQTGLTVLYDSRPAITVKSFDAIIRSSLVFSL